MTQHSAFPIAVPATLEFPSPESLKYFIKLLIDALEEPKKSNYIKRDSCAKLEARKGLSKEARQQVYMNDLKLILAAAGTSAVQRFTEEYIEATAAVNRKDEHKLRAMLQEIESQLVSSSTTKVALLQANEVMGNTALEIASSESMEAAWKSQSERPAPGSSRSLPDFASTKFKEVYGADPEEAERVSQYYHRYQLNDATNSTVRDCVHRCMFLLKGPEAITGTSTKTSDFNFDVYDVGGSIMDDLPQFEI
ncbi:hypothetical protein C8R47DRAFT_1315612 [Mycena vitilis]|nr:hypothetical protein C8R47DRAFT_1315612 [Mycena vitilis]